jgi:hypothetical protein
VFKKRKKALCQHTAYKVFFDLCASGRFSYHDSKTLPEFFSAEPGNAGAGNAPCFGNSGYHDPCWLHGAQGKWAIDALPCAKSFGVCKKKFDKIEFSGLKSKDTTVKRNYGGNYV